MKSEGRGGSGCRGGAGSGIELVIGEIDGRPELGGGRGRVEE